MSANPIEEARRILDRAAKAVAEARLRGQPSAVVGRYVLESIHRFTSTVGSNLHLDRARADCERDLDEKRARLFSRKTDLLGQLNQLRQDAAARFPAIVEPAQTGGPEDPFSRRASLTGFDRWMAGAGKEPAKIDEEGDHLGCATPADALCVILKRLLPEDVPVEDNDPRLATLLRAEALKDELTKVRRTQILLGKIHPAAKWARFLEIVRDCNPEVGSVAWHIGSALDSPPFRHYARFLHDEGSLEREDHNWLETFAAEVANDVITIASELQSRLGTRASTRWLLERYARRCRWLRLQELNASVAATKSDRKEPFLTRDAAVFLFDQGLNVLTEQSLGQHRYDVIGESLLLEAKIFSDRKTPLAAVVNGLRQLHQYDAALGNEGLKLEAVLVLFRLGGRSVDLLPEYTVGNLRVAVVLVDLGPSSQSGSRAKTSFNLTAEAVATELARPPKKRPRPKTRTARIEIRKAISTRRSKP